MHSPVHGEILGCTNQPRISECTLLCYITSSTTKRLEDIVDFNLKLYPLLKCAKENNLGIQTIFVEKPQKSDTKRKPKYCSFVRMMNYLKEHQEIECVLISGFEGITRDYEKITEIYDLHKMLYIVYGNNHSTLSHAMDSGEVLKKTMVNVWDTNQQTNCKSIQIL